MPGIFLLRWLPDIVRGVGAVLAVLGLLMWVVGAVTVMRAYNRDELVTSGVFPLVRHPMYAAWITLVFPGLALFTRSWPMFFTPLIAYSILRRLIHSEDEYLERRFGQGCLDYRRRVNEVVPIPRCWPKGR